MVYNSFGAGPEDTFSLKICIMGDPVVTFKDRNTTSDITVPYVKGDPQALDADRIPRIDDDSFEGWYYDEKYTEKWNLADPIDSHKTLYAKYTQSQSFMTSPYLPISFLAILAISIFGIWVITGRRT